MRPRSSQAGSPNLVAVTLIEHFVSSTLIENSMIFEMSADPRLIAGSPDSERMDGHHEKKLMTKKHNTYLIVLIQTVRHQLSRIVRQNPHYHPQKRNGFAFTRRRDGEQTARENISRHRLRILRPCSLRELPSRSLAHLADGCCHCAERILRRAERR